MSDPPGAARRIALRFRFVYLLLYFAPFPLSAVPFADKFFEEHSVMRAIVPWVGAHVLHLSRPIMTETNGSGDRTFNWVEVLCYAVAALVVSIVWGSLDRSRARSASLEAGLRVYVRYALGSIILAYGFAKFLGQFPFPGPSRLAERFGEASPMGLLWAFMGYSRAYSVFTGGAEILGGALLFFRRTTTLGALIVAGVMANVVMLNFCYDVPVKLESTHFLALALLLLAPDLRRLADVLVLNRATQPADIAWPEMSERARRARIGAKILVLACAAYALFDLSTSERAPPPISLAGAYEVDTFESAAEPRAAPWHRVTVNPWGAVSLEPARGEVRPFWAKVDDAKGELELLGKSGAPAATLAFTREGDALTLRGVFEGATIDARLRRIDDARWPLVTRGFHWVSEAPYNR